jgi:hypothetical protein
MEECKLLIERSVVDRKYRLQPQVEFQYSSMFILSPSRNNGNPSYLSESSQILNVDDCDLMLAINSESLFPSCPLKKPYSKACL